MVSDIGQSLENSRDHRIRDWEDARRYLEPIVQELFNQDLKAGEYKRAERIHAAWRTLISEI